MFSKIAQSFLVLIFAFQLITLAPNLPVPYHSFGDFTPIPEQNAALLPQDLYQATFSSQVEDKKDALLFTGDILLARNVEFLMKKEGVEYPFALLNLAALSERPAVVGNFEAAMSPAHIPTPPLAMNFSVDAQFLSGLKNAGFTHVSLANNHSFDYGFEGYEHAVSTLQTQGIIPFGNGRGCDADSVSIIDTDFGRVALIAINATFGQPEKTDIHELFTYAKMKSDLQIVYVHWGTEYEASHSPDQELLATRLVDEGADLIVGHHPHVVQDIALINKVLVFYSLGNYIFDQYFSNEVQTGLVLALTSANGAPAAQLLPVTSIGHRSQPSYMSPEAHAAFLQQLAAKSDPNIAPDIERGRISIPTLVASSPKMAMMVR